MTGSEHSLSNPAYLRSVPCHVYNMTKHSVLSLGDSLRAELEPDGIGVSVLCPGPVVTGLTHNSGASRPDRFGGPTEIAMASVSEEQMELLQTLHQPASQAAATTLEGLRRNLFVIPTHMFTREDAAARHRDIERGFELLD
jgi:short-subunit dehydrogenase